MTYGFEIKKLDLVDIVEFYSELKNFTEERCGNNFSLLGIKPKIVENYLKSLNSFAGFYKFEDSKNECETKLNKCFFSPQDVVIRGIFDANQNVIQFYNNFKMGDLKADWIYLYLTDYYGHTLRKASVYKSGNKIIINKGFFIDKRFNVKIDEAKE